MGLNYFKKLMEFYVINQVKHIKLHYYEPSSTVRKSVVFSGRVQKVGFRLEIYEIAKRLNLTGWVKNTYDNNVEAEIQGENEKIIFLNNYMKSLKRASVQNIEINEMPIVIGETDFVFIRK